MLEFIGTLYRINPIVNYESPKGGTFPERVFIMKYIDPEGREQMVKFSIEPPANMNMIEDFELGQQLKIKFYFFGRETVSRFNNGIMNFYEKKKVISIEQLNKSKDPHQHKNQPIHMPVNGYVGPDLTQDFSMFSDILEF